MKRQATDYQQEAPGVNRALENFLSPPLSPAVSIE
jgi:hypothetical protein